MSERLFFSLKKRTSLYDQLNKQTVTKKFRIVPEWEKDENLQRTEPKQSFKQCFMVRRKQQIQKNRWKTIIKQISNVEEERDNNIEQFNRRISVKIDRNNQASLMRFMEHKNSQSLPSIHESFQKKEVFDRLVHRTQPYWKKFMSNN